MKEYLAIVIFISLLNFFTNKLIIRSLLPIFNERSLAKIDKRSMHNKPTPTGGAILLVASSLFFYSLIKLKINTLGINQVETFNYFYILILISSIIGIFGFMDDLYYLRNNLKFAFQSLISILLVNFLNTNLFLSHQNLLFFIIYFILIIFISGIINIINFMDGIDGLICGIFSMIFLILAIKVNILYFPLSAGLFSFLYVNWHPAEIFMGDAGSTYIGSIFAGTIISADTLQESLSILLLASPLLLDASICILRRLVAGQNIFSPHKLHLYQRLVQNGLSHSKVAIIYISFCFIIAIFYLYNNFSLEILTTLFALVIGIILDKKYAFSFKEGL